MYTFFLNYHGYIRWVILLTALFVVLKHFWDWWQYGRITPWSQRAAIVYIVILHLQFVFGAILLWFISPWGPHGVPDDWLQNPVHRFRLLEHPLLMVAAIAVALFGRRWAKRKSEPLDAVRIASWAYLISLAIILFSIRW